MTNPDNPNIINFDLWKQAAGGRHQIGTLAGFRSEQVAGFLLECMAGFVGIRKLCPNPLKSNIRAWSGDRLALFELIGLFACSNFGARNGQPE